MTAFNHLSGQYLQVNDAKIYFEVAGAQEGEPLVLLHGGLGNLTDFNEIISKLPNHFKFIGIDFRGHGKSTLGTSAMTYQQHQFDVEAVLEYLKIDLFSVIGFSDGGTTAYRMAINTPSRIKTLVTVGAPSQIDPKEPIFSLLSGVSSKKWREIFPESVSYYTEVNPTPNFDTLIKSVVSLWTDTEITGYPYESIKQIKIPTLIVRGDDDHLFSLKEAVNLREHIENSHFINIPFSGHEVHKDTSIYLLEVVKSFFHKNNAVA
ncbi:MAG: alpha/beta hydrolase [Colwellia sp.]|nr:alpha/beta hydrolase [Colwellia sp.]